MNPLESQFSLQVERIFIWAGLVLVIGFSLGVWTLAKFIPPPAPSAGAIEIANIYAQNSTGIIGGSLFVITSAIFLLMFCIAVSSAMDRHNPNGILLSRIQIAGAIVNVTYFSFMGMFWMVAAYRMDADSTETRLFNDIAWIIMVVPTAAFVMQLIAVGSVALTKPQDRAIFPRWSGYLSLWCALLFVPGMFSGFFKTGPIAWNGVLSFWLEVIVFLIWVVVMFIVMNRALPKTIPDKQQAPATGNPVHS